MTYMEAWGHRWMVNPWIERREKTDFPKSVSARGPCWDWWSWKCTKTKGKCIIIIFNHSSHIIFFLQHLPYPVDYLSSWVFFFCSVCLLYSRVVSVTQLYVILKAHSQRTQQQIRIRFLLIISNPIPLHFYWEAEESVQMVIATVRYLCVHYVTSIIT